MTDLLQRYLAAVERRLPEAQAADIVAELGEVLSAKIEALEAELGRAADAAEVAAVLKAFGHPVVVASRYAGADYVIGPTYYPWFWHVQRIAVGLAIAIGFGVTTARALGSLEPFEAAFKGFYAAAHAAILVFGAVTVAFIVAERSKLDMKWTERWNPRSLPRDNIRRPKSLFDSAVMLLFDIIFLLWWAKVVSFPNEIPVGRGTSSVVAIHLASAWDAIWQPVLVLAVASALVHGADLVRPAWSRWRAVASIAGHVCGLAIFAVLFQADPLVSATPAAGADGLQAERMVGLFDDILRVSLAVAAVIWTAAIWIEAQRLWRSGRPAAANGVAV